MKLSIGLTLLAALVGFGLVAAVGRFLLVPTGETIVAAEFAHARITPNADGEDDITTFRYELRRNAEITLQFTSADGQVFTFRERQPRIAGEYRVPFSGVVGGFILPGERFINTIERRLMPNGLYTWTLQAVDEEGNLSERSGTLEIAEADTALPLITSFSVGPSTFSPNQDGIADRVNIEVYLEKEATLRVYLLDKNGIEIPIAARRGGRMPGEAGRHVFDYEGGVDLGADPPPDGTYTVIAEAQDAVGQRVTASASLTIEMGGKPRAEIVPQVQGVDVVFVSMPYEERFASGFDVLGDLVPPPDDPQSLAFSSITMPLGDMLVFMLTVENYNNVPIRTTYPPPGTVYQQSQSAASLGAFESSGAWRVGIQCETSTTSFPYRWALGSPETLMPIPDPRDGTVHYYVPPNSRVVVWGGIRFTDIERRQNPQRCWAGLIQEDVEVSLRNSYVGAREIELVDPNANNPAGR
ncbi:MAG: hypothetical protein SNJ54_04630 [Anaerolineae bacterium]